MGSQPLGEERFGPALGRKTTSAALIADKNCACFRNSWKRSLTRSPISFQHALRSLIEMLSMPGCASPVPIVKTLTSSSVTMVPQEIDSCCSASHVDKSLVELNLTASVSCRYSARPEGCESHIPSTNLRGVWLLTIFRFSPLLQFKDRRIRGGLFYLHLPVPSFSFSDSISKFAPSHLNYSGRICSIPVGLVLYST